jgi:hypothetical protein
MHGTYTPITVPIPFCTTSGRQFILLSCAAVTCCCTSGKTETPTVPSRPAATLEPRSVGEPERSGSLIPCISGQPLADDVGPPVQTVLAGVMDYTWTFGGDFLWLSVSTQPKMASVAGCGFLHSCRTGTVTPQRTKHVRLALANWAPTRSGSTPAPGSASDCRTHGLRVTRKAHTRTRGLCVTRNAHRRTHKRARAPTHATVGPTAQHFAASS